MKVSYIISDAALLLSIEILSYVVLTYWGVRFLFFLSAAMGQQNII